MDVFAVAADAVEIYFFEACIFSDVVENEMTELIGDQGNAILCCPNIMYPDFNKWHIEVRLKPGPYFLLLPPTEVGGNKEMKPRRRLFSTKVEGS